MLSGAGAISIRFPGWELVLALWGHFAHQSLEQCPILGRHIRLCLRCESLSVLTLGDEFLLSFLSSRPGVRAEGWWGGCHCYTEADSSAVTDLPGTF